MSDFESKARTGAEDRLVSAFGRLTEDERAAVRESLVRRLPICVGSWGVNGEKQTYSCIMGTAAAVMAGQTVPEWVALMSQDDYFLQDTLSYAGQDDVPGAFDSLFEQVADVRSTCTVPTVGGETRVLNRQGRELLLSLLDRAEA